MTDSTTLTRLDGQTAVITGGTDGIGKQIALRLAQRGAHVTLVGRNPSKGAEVVRQIQQSAPGVTVRFEQADLSLMKEVQRLGQRLKTQNPRLDMLVHCAGVTLRQRTLTSEGLETVFAVQYLARMALTDVLLASLQAAPQAHIVNVSAGGTVNVTFDFDNLQGEKHYNGAHALQHESIANDMLVLEWARRNPALTFYNYGPGVVRTTLLRDMPGWFRVVAKVAGVVMSISPEQAAEDVLTLLTSTLESGLYTRKAKSVTPKSFRADLANRQRLWDISVALLTTAGT